MLFHCNNGRMNAPQCYVIRTMHVLFSVSLLLLGSGLGLSEGTRPSVACRKWGKSLKQLAFKPGPPKSKKCQLLNSQSPLSLQILVMQLLMFKSDVLTYPKSDPIPLQFKLSFFYSLNSYQISLAYGLQLAKKCIHTKQQDTAILREDGLSFKYKHHATIQNEIFLEVNFTLSL